MVDSASHSDSFIFVKATTNDEKSPKRPAWIKGPVEAEYEAVRDEEKEWVNKEMREQILNTVSAIEAKQLRDKYTAYVVLGVESHFVRKDDPSEIWKQVFYDNTLTVLEHLSAEILCYLNLEHTKLLISCPLSKLMSLVARKNYSRVYFKTIKRVSPLFLEEQVSENLRDSQWSKEPKDVIIELIPNLSPEKKQEYASKLMENLKLSDVNAQSCCDNDFVLTSLNQESTEQLLKVSNYVFRVSEIPKGLLGKMSLSRKNKRSRSNQSIRGRASSVGSDRTAYDNLPIVCVLDSGVNEIPQLTGLLIGRDRFRRFPDFNDDFGERGHGTPIAYLTAFGENSSIPKARVISYKIYSDTDRRLYPEGYQLAISKYSSEANPKRSHIFVSSIVFERYNDAITASIDKWIQKNNICAAFSTGNIESDVVNDYAYKGVPCASYILHHPVKDPAQAVNALAIGAIAKKEAPNSISRMNELAPFTRCGINNGFLYDCQKPEFIEHGGNYCKDGTVLGVASIDRNGQSFDGFLGTSFSAPLFVYHLAEIYARYGHRFENAETLKAIAMALSSGEVQGCRGFGELKSLNDFNYDLQALVCAEGTIPLRDTLSDSKFNIDFTAKISVSVPKLVNCIKMFLVHSDNHFREAKPHLNTYLLVRARKTARDYGGPDPSNKKELYRKSNMKIFKWAYESQSMEATWDFYITPRLTADMLAEHQQATTIRYGCAILINSKTLARDVPLTQQVYDLNKQLGVIR
ncbi:MAG: S8 family serine peptidase [Candidatus Bathyarchaeia archaeon]